MVQIDFQNLNYMCISRIWQYVKQKKWHIDSGGM